MSTYVYIGIEINQNLSIDDHIKRLKRKIQYIVYAIVPIRKAEMNVKFLHLWQITMRPLLDYTQTCLSFLKRKLSAHFCFIYKNIQEEDSHDGIRWSRRT